jgi:hypothetical protein
LPRSYQHSDHGNLDPDLINTSFVERQNLIMHMSMCRFTPLTDAFSKKFGNRCHTLALYFVFYSFCRFYKTLGATLAMAVGIVDRVMHIKDWSGLIDARAAEASVIRGAYKKHAEFQTGTLPTTGASA